MELRVSAKTLRRLRTEAAVRQAHLCYYCDVPMWDGDSAQPARQLGLSHRILRALQCTAEHLIPRSDGGPETAQNIVAACFFCNRMRHKRKSLLTPEQYLSLVRRRLRNGRWHPPPVHKAFKIGAVAQAAR
jgi:5-methylcytosine-specific restriction endonuclease McrA